jgi:Multiubiquitin
MTTEAGSIEAQHGPVHNIFVNGKARQFEGAQITYEVVVRLAYPDGPVDIIYTVSYVNPHGHDGTLAPGQKTSVHEGMEFVVRKTGRS